MSQPRADIPVPTIAEAARQLRAGETSSSELVERCLAAIEAHEPTLAACVTVLGEKARAQAREADERRAQSGRTSSPLLGIPLGIKDLIETRGIRTTAGSRVLDDFVPDEDATIYAKLRQAGAVAVAKTNTHEFAFGTVTQPTRNPWDLSRIPGGSSGGTAAGLAAGEFLGGLGTDTGGSIRIPAAWCGVTGLKPTYGLVSRAGIIPLSWSLDHAGPIGASVEDCALLLDAIAGYDPRDSDSVDVPLISFTAALAAKREPDEAVRGLRIGVVENYFFDLIDVEVADAIWRTACDFEALGTRIETIHIPGMRDDLLRVYRTIQRPEAYLYHSESGWLESRADRYTPDVLELIRGGADYSAAQYVRAKQEQRAFTDEMRAVLSQFDALLMPTMAMPAPTVEEAEAPLLVNGQALVGGALRCTLPFDLTGQPAMSIPCGFTRSGLPIGAQLAAGHFSEATLLRLGHAYQRVTDWHLRRPALS